MKPRVILPVDALEENWPSELKGVSLGGLLHPASVNSRLCHTKTVLSSFNGKLFKLSALFGPQHGIRGETQDNMIEWEGFSDPELHIPVYSLYGEHREPTEKMFKNIDCLFIDLQDAGTRYYTFIWSLYLCMKAANVYKKIVIVCDRPNPINCVQTEGPVLEITHASFVGLHPIPVRHGKTIGELAKLFKNECFPDLALYVLPMRNYSPLFWFDQTGLPWVMPSPNMPTPDTAIVYPGMCLFEATNISEGRGTTRPFEIFGAPFIDSAKLCGQLNGKELPGVYFRETHFIPTFNKFHGMLCHGAQIHVINRNIFNSFDTGIKILGYLYHEYPSYFKWKGPPYEYETVKLPIDILLGNGWYRKEYIEK
jgi:uncharacterized protein YbbC (DUF1343 family)